MLSLIIPVFQIAHNSLTNSDLISGCLMPYLDMRLQRCLSHSLFSGLKHATSNGCSTSVTYRENFSMIIFCFNAFSTTGADMWVKYQCSTYLFRVLSWKFVLLEPYVGWIKLKTYSPTNFVKPSQPIGQYISLSHWKQICCLKLTFCRPNRHLFVRIQQN